MYYKRGACVSEYKRAHHVVPVGVGTSDEIRTEPRDDPLLLCIPGHAERRAMHRKSDKSDMQPVNCLIFSFYRIIDLNN